MTHPVPTPAWPRAAVFDCDGLLVDSAPCWHDAYRAVVRDHGLSLDGVDVAALAGASVAAAATTLSTWLDVDISDGALRSALRDSFVDRPPRSLPGAASLIGALSRRMPLAVASNAPADILTEVLARLGAHSAVSVVVSAEEIEAPKPAPDVYLEACRRLGVEPCDAIAFEDSVVGARAATTAGLVVVGVPSARGLRLDADLVVSRLDDPQLLHMLRVDTNGQARRV
jgi:HAD superfamily hydrolase (TIGR01509 family)